MTKSLQFLVRQSSPVVSHGKVKWDDEISNQIRLKLIKIINRCGSIRGFGSMRADVILNNKGGEKTGRIFLESKWRKAVSNITFINPYGQTI